MIILEETESDKLTLLKTAINNKVEISFWYKGIDYVARKKRGATNAKQNWRFAQPTDLGKSKATNKWMLRAYQNGGTSNTTQNAWKTFLVDEMSSITLLDGEDGKYYRPFEKPTGSGFNTTGDKKMKNDKPELKIDLNKKPIDNQNKKIIDKEPTEEPIVNSEPETEELTENRSFSKWILNLNYGS